MVYAAAYRHTTDGGKTVNARTEAALTWARRHSGIRFSLSQGSYNRGGVAASGGTHDGGGAVDISVRGLTTRQRSKVVHALKNAGFAAWYRKPIPGLWGAHIHAILLDDREASYGAQSQMRAYLAKRDGLRGNRPDNTYRPKPQVRFSLKQNKPVER